MVFRWQDFVLAVRSDDKESVNRALDELEALYLNGPAAGGGVRRAASPLVETESGFIPRGEINLKVRGTE